MGVILGIILIVLGLGLVCKPTITWMIQKHLFLKDGEPATFYYIVARVSGVLAMIVGVIVMIYA